MNLVLLGAPGSGKGTQAELISKKYGWPHISTGEIFRNIKAGKSSLAEAVKGYIDRGQLVPDSITVDIVEQRISESDCERGFLLDGFPRSIYQAEILGVSLGRRGMGIDCVLYLALPDEAIIRRLEARRVCPGCGRDYNLVTQPPKENGKCDACGTQVARRVDDNIKIIRERLNVYRKETQPLVDYYIKKKVLSEIDASKTIEEVSVSVKEFIDLKCDVHRT
ncbi:MAG: adenylate kinase [Elusimicrobiota bacterium]